MGSGQTKDKYKSGFLPEEAFASASGSSLTCDLRGALRTEAGEDPLPSEGWLGLSVVDGKLFVETANSARSVVQTPFASQVLICVGRQKKYDVRRLADREVWIRPA